MKRFVFVWRLFGCFVMFTRHLCEKSQDQALFCQTDSYEQACCRCRRRFILATSVACQQQWSMRQLPANRKCCWQGYLTIDQLTKTPVCDTKLPSVKSNRQLVDWQISLPWCNQPSALWQTVISDWKHTSWYYDRVPILGQRCKHYIILLQS